MRIACSRSRCAQTGENAATVDHLVAAIAGDYYQYGNLAAEPELKDFLATQHGQAVALLATQIRDEYAKRVKAGLWLVARRSTFKWPSKPGVRLPNPLRRSSCHDFQAST